MVHVGGDFPFGYDDATLQAIQASGGGVAGSLDEAITRLTVSLEGASQPDVLMRDIVDGYEWLTIPAGSATQIDGKITTHSIDDPFTALAARRLILGEMCRQRGQIDEIETLDALHAIALEQGIVTPYSSMIVLVNTAQVERLRELENQENRFDREAEDVGETAPAPFEVTGVPEPHEWLLIGLSVAILAWYTWHKRMTFQREDTRHT
jgi:putative PEP-CTERM system integral membrane protein